MRLHHHQRDRQHQRKLHILDRRANRGGAVGKNIHMHGGGKRRLKLRKKFLHAIDHRDDVRAGLPLNIQNDGGVPIGPGGLLGIFNTVDNRGDVGQPHGRAVTVGNDQRTVAVAGNKLIVCADGVSLMQAVKRAFGLIDVGLAQRGAQVFKAQSVGSQGCRIRLDAHCRTLAATNADKPDAAELRNFLSERGVREVFHFG